MATAVSSGGAVSSNATHIDTIDAASGSVTRILPDGTVVPGLRADWLNIGDLLARNWSVIPLRPRGKKPAVEWAAYQHRMPTSDELASWFDRPEPRNVGIVTGKVSGLFVLDLDSAEAIDWGREHLPPCEMRFRTCKGVHLYYPYSGDIKIRNKARVVWKGRALAIDVRGAGGYVVAPGSVHPSGFVYSREGSGW